MGVSQKEMVWLDGSPQTPPIPSEVRVEAGYLFRLLQSGMPLGMPHSRPMPTIGKNCHELRISGAGTTWRFAYCLESDAVVSLGIFCKKTRKTPKQEIDACKQRLKLYRIAKGERK
jgi:phage-related protein